MAESPKADHLWAKGSRSKNNATQSEACKYFMRNKGNGVVRINLYLPIELMDNKALRLRRRKLDETKKNTCNKYSENQYFTRGIYGHKKTV